MNELKNSPLGKTVATSDKYAPSLLFPIPRIGKRTEIGIGTKLPFIGVDIWNAFELSWLNSRGIPQAYVGEFVFPAESPNIVESKSFKLYLQSFNQSYFNSVEEVRDTLIKDLTKASEAPVSVKLYKVSDLRHVTIQDFKGTCIDNLDVEVDTYTYQPQFLKNGSGSVEETLVSHVLKSNCLITNQPDWASVCIKYKGLKIEHEGLLKYLVSFRTHNEFHEQCVERIFVDIMHYCKPEQLSVYARYTRRGGLDINPFRSSMSQYPDNIRNTRQ
jgi:7-cyano-7-deazaguanine reductase